MDFLDQQAEESENDSSEVSDDEQPVRKKRKVEKSKKKKKHRIVSSDEEDDEDNGDEDARIQQEMAGFVVENDDEIDEDADDDDRSSRHSSDNELSDEDLAVINENTGYGLAAKAVIDDDEDDDEVPHHHPPGVDEEEDGYDDEEDYDAVSEADEFIVEDDGARKKTRHRMEGVSEQTLREVHDIFGVDDFDMNEFYDDEGQEEAESDEEGMTRERRPKGLQLLQELDPNELEKARITEEDRNIIAEDRPERFITRRVPMTEGTDEEYLEEASWLQRVAFSSSALSIQKSYTEIDSSPRPINSESDIFKERLADVVNYLRTQCWEVPFMAFYRKESLNGDFTQSDLWRVYNYDERFQVIYHRRQRLLALFRRVRDYLEANAETSARRITYRDEAAISSAATNEEVNDASILFETCYARFFAQVGRWEASQNGAISESDALDLLLPHFKTLTKKTFVDIAMQERVAEFAEKYLTSGSVTDFADAVLECRAGALETSETMPEDQAIEFVGSTIKNPADMVAMAVRYTALMLSRELAFRNRVRVFARGIAEVSAWPTQKGRDMITDSMPVFGLRYLKNKPVSQFKYEEFAILKHASDEKLIEISITLGQTTDENFDDTFLTFFEHVVDDGLPRASWIKLRNKAVTQALRQHLFPQLIKEISGVLLREAQDEIVRLVQDAYKERIAIASYRKTFTYEDDEYGVGDRAGDDTRIMSIAYAPEADLAAFAVVVNHLGDVIDNVRLANFYDRLRPFDNNCPKARDLKILSELILNRRPHIITISGENLDAERLRKDVMRVVQQLVESNDLPQVISVDIFRNDIAKVFAQSMLARQEMADFVPVQRQAVSMARQLADPLVEVTRLFTSERDILCVHWHPLQKMISEHDLLWCLEQETISQVAQVGVDLNALLDYPFRGAPLPYVPGLGPRKANAVVKCFRTTGQHIDSRSRLIQLCSLGPKVFMNCAGFLIVDATKIEDDHVYIELLDGSRVHPESYEIARKMAADALEVDDNDPDESPIEKVINNPHRLKVLDLEAFANEMNSRGLGDKNVTLHDIRAELAYRYKDLRKPYMSPTNEEMFRILSPETENVFAPGKLVLGDVKGLFYSRKQLQEDDKHPKRNAATGEWQCNLCMTEGFPEFEDVFDHYDKCPGRPLGYRVILENGMNGSVFWKDLSDEHDSIQDKWTRMIKPNTTLTFRIKDIDSDRFKCNLTCKSSDLQAASTTTRLDEYYDYERCKNDDAALDLKRMRREPTSFVKRVITHANFHNINSKDAEKMLKKMKQGEAIIRPSSSSRDNLVVTWKVTDGVYQHVTVHEENKQHHFNIGKTLYIDNESFEDLDEILARFVHPMASSAREIFKYRYFLDHIKAEDRAQINAFLQTEKELHPGRIPYCLTVSAKYPGSFLLSYGSGRHEYVTLKSYGYSFRNKHFTTLLSLINWFKANYREPPPGRGMPGRGSAGGGGGGGGGGYHHGSGYYGR